MLVPCSSSFDFIDSQNEYISDLFAFSKATNRALFFAAQSSTAVVESVAIVYPVWSLFSASITTDYSIV